MRYKRLPAMQPSSFGTVNELWEICSSNTFRMLSYPPEVVNDDRCISELTQVIEDTDERIVVLTLKAREGRRALAYLLAWMHN